MVSASLFLFIFLCAAPARPDAAVSPSSPADRFIALAQGKNLARSKGWRILLHYKEVTLGTESLIDDPTFFLAPEGKTDPEGELAATIAEFFRTDMSGESHAACRFPARFRWLDKETGFASSAPKVSCPELEKAVENVNPKGTAMIFASAHINSPASMFGHPLIRIDSEMESKLLSQAVNYAAQTEEKRGPMFAFYGIFGYYLGLYSLLPYYEKVSEYNDFDLRDLWEYHLNLTQDETRMMLYHLWELKDKYSYYYFFDENCAYIILYLLEAARPTLALTDGWGNYVIPVDTLRRVMNAGIVDHISYRPSKMTKMKAIAGAMDAQSIQTAKRISKGEISAAEGIKPFADDEAKKKTLDMAVELIQLRYGSKEIEKGDFQKLFLATLKERGGIGGEPPVVREIVPPLRPDLGHSSGAFSYGLESNSGARGNRQTFSFRPALHDLMDPQEGFVAGSEIQFFAFSLSLSPALSRLWLEKLDLVTITSLSPLNRLFTPVSWKVRGGVDRRDFANGAAGEALVLNTGGGYSVETGDIGLAYIFFEADLEANRNFDKGYAIGPGLSLGLILDPIPYFKTGVRLRGVRFVMGDTTSEYEISFSERYSVSRNLGIHLDLKGNRVGDREIKTAAIRLIIFF